MTATKSKQSKIRCQFLHTRNNSISLYHITLFDNCEQKSHDTKIGRYYTPCILYYTPAYYFIQVKSTVKTNYICTRGQFGPLHICVGESPKCCIAVVVFEPHNLLSAVRLSPHTVGQNRPQCSRINLFACLFIWTQL